MSATVALHATWRELGGALATPHASAAGRWGHRRGLVLALRDAAGRRGLGEASPLPGVSRDDLDGAARAFAAVAAALPFALADDDSAARGQIGDLAARCAGDAPAAQCAIETALFDLRGRTIDRAPSVQLGGDGAGAMLIALNALVADPAGARAAVARGRRCLKVKLGGAAFVDDLARLAAIRAAVGSSIALRADANRAWPDETLAARLTALAPLALEYVEEPIAGGGRALAAISDVDASALALPLALDESLAEPDAEDWLDAALARRRIAVLVLKPMLLGGPLRCTALAARARAAGADVVISHLVDGPIALAAAHELARAVAPRRACGLDAHAGLAAWPALHDAGAWP